MIAVRTWGLTLGFGAMMLAGPALADDVVSVTLTDMDGSAQDITKNLGMGIGMKGDASKSMFHVELDKKVVPAGKVTFKVSNGAKELEHEMLVIPLKDENTPLPFVDGENRADEDAAGSIGEVAELAPGKSGEASFDLKPGLYALLCNVPGHYGAGMWATLKVE